MQGKKLQGRSRMVWLYFIGKFGFCMLTCTELYYFSSFMTDSALLSSALVSMILTITAAGDTVSSFISGIIVEKVHLPWGQHRSWLLVGPLIYAIPTVIMFCKIGSDIVAAVVIIIAFLVGHLFWSVTEAAYYALNTLLTDDLDERSALSISSGRASLGSGLLFGFISMPIVNFCAGLFGPGFGYAGLAGLLTILSIATYWLLFFVTKGCEPTRKEAVGEEAAAVKEAEKVPLGVMYKAVFTNRDLVIMIICVALSYAQQFLGAGLQYYYFSLNLGNLGAMGMFLTIRSAVAFLASWWTSLLLKLCRGNKKVAYVLSYAFCAIFLLIPWFMRPTSVIGYTIPALIGCLLGSSGSLLQGAMYSDCAEESEYKIQMPVKGFIMAFMSLPIKLGVLIKAVLLGAVLTSVGYVAGMDVTESVLSGFNNGYLLIPAVMCVIIIVLCVFAYRLTEAKAAEYIAANNARAKAAAEEHAAAGEKQS